MVNDQVYYVRPSLDGEGDEAQRRIDTKGLRPLIIPPSLEKALFFEHPLIKAIWSDARAAIDRMVAHLVP